MTIANQEDTSMIPKEILETADLAIELHGKMFPQDAEDGTPQIDNNDEGQSQAPAPEDENSETYKQRFSTLQGKFNSEVPRLSNMVKELERRVEELSSHPGAPSIEDAKKAPTPNAQLEEILAKLKEEYSEELIDNFAMIARLQAQSLVEEQVSPIRDIAAATQAKQHSSEQEEYVAGLNEKAPNWQKIWTVVSEIDNGLDPSDPDVAKFLNAPDPSGLYTNKELLDKYNEVWDMDRFAKVCNMYGGVAPQQTRPAPNPTRDAMLAPSRTNSQPSPQSNEKKVWTISEFRQFQADERAGRYSEEEAEVIWHDVQSALAEGRMH